MEGGRRWRCRRRNRLGNLVRRRIDRVVFDVCHLEAAIVVTLPPGAYTAIVTGVGGTTGVGIVEVFAR